MAAEEPDIADEFDETCTVTVALDLDGIPKPAAKSISFFDMVGPPARASEMFVAVDSGIMISDIPVSIRHILCTHLDVRAAGTMRNWERIGQQLGMHINAIDALRVPRSQPTEGVLQFARKKSISLLRLLIAIRDENRVDTLIALRSSLFKLSDEISKAGGLERWRIGKFSNTDSEEFMSLVSRDLPGPANPPRPRRPLPEQFILVTHHEEGVDADERKRFKFLMRNIQAWGAKKQVEVLDIDKCIDEVNIHSCFTEAFTRAKTIAVVVTRAYRERVLSYSDDANQLLQIKRNLHQHMDLECTRNQGNLRFRVILFSKDDERYIPIGWPQNTFHYMFPEHYEQIANKLFNE